MFDGIDCCFMDYSTENVNIMLSLNSGKSHRGLNKGSWMIKENLLHLVKLGAMQEKER